MVRTRCFLFFSLIMLATTACADLSQLVRGTVLTPENEDEIARESLEYARAWQNHLNNEDGVVVSFFRINNTDNLYSLADNSVLHLTNFSSRASLGRWPITRWPYEYIATQIKQRLQEEGAYEFSPNPKITILVEPQNYNGCLSQNPLRYGDVDSNGSKEIVLLMNQDIILFSPELKKPIFQLRWIEERADGYYADNGDPVEIPSELKGDYPQFNDPFTKGQLYAGLRAYAKMYVGEFNGNQTPDILVWHKLYESNMFGQPEGFRLIHEHLIHYELITSSAGGQQPTGEYLPMNTSEDVIRQWLAAKNLTWQKGYPNLSECPGQTDKHIPEMVDPLLNDPDVLK